MSVSIKEIITMAADIGTSDIHIAYNLPPKARIDGELQELPFPVMTDELLDELAREMLGHDMPEIGEEDFSFSCGDNRIRANIYRVSGHLSVALRLIPKKIPLMDDLGLPPAVYEFPKLKRGIVLVTGQTGSGKSTTLASVLQKINETRNDHIITLEDPIEYVYDPCKCIVDQREIGQDTVSYSEGLRASLREDPDVILIGEMRDLDTIETAITAAETGHLVFATLHCSSAEDSIDRMVSVFPAEKQPQIRMELSMTLVAVLSQSLLKKKDGGRVAAVEVMVVTPAIRHLIREGKTPQIANAIATGAQEGSIPMDRALINLYKARKISAEVALAAARDPEYMKREVRV